MRDPRRRFVRYGVVVAAGTALVLAAAHWVPRFLNDEYTVCFSDVEGLAKGSPVLSGGYAVGQVVGITPANRRDVKDCPGQAASCIAVRLRVEPGATPPVRTLTIFPRWFGLGIVAIRIDAAAPPDAADPSACEGRRQQSALEEIAHDLKDIAGFKVKVDDLLTNLNAHVSKTGDDIGDIVADVKEWSKPKDGKFAELTRNLPATVNQVNELAGRLTHATERVENLLGQNSETVRRSLVDLEFTLRQTSASIAAITDDLQGTTENLFELTAELRQNPAFLVTGRSSRPPDPVPADAGR